MIDVGTGLTLVLVTIGVVWAVVDSVLTITTRPQGMGVAKAIRSPHARSERILAAVVFVLAATLLVLVV